MAPAARTWHSSRDTVKRFDRDLTSPSLLLRVHFWSYTPISTTHCSAPPPSCALPPPPIASNRRRRRDDVRQLIGASPSSLCRPRCLHKATCTYPGLSGRHTNQGCCMVAAHVKSNLLVPPSLLLFERSIFWRFWSSSPLFLKSWSTRPAPCSSAFHMMLPDTAYREVSCTTTEVHCLALSQVQPADRAESCELTNGLFIRP